jgi:hypothetical protein
MNRRKEFKALKERVNRGLKGVHRALKGMNPPKPVMNNYSTYGDVTNLGFKAAVTSTVVAASVTPIRIATKNMYRPPGAVKLSFVHQVTKAIVPNLKSGQLRGSVSVTSKHVSTHEGEPSEPKSKTKGADTDQPLAKAWLNSSTAQALTFAQVDTLASSYHSNLGDLKANGVQVPEFSLRGALSIFKVGYFFKSVSGFVSFGALIKATDAVEGFLPKTVRENKAYGKYVSGALTGAVAAIFNFPIKHMENKVMAQARYNASNDTITSPNCVSFFKQEIANLSKTGFRSTMTEFFKFAMRGPLPANMAQTMVIFGLLNGINSALGDKPVDDIAQKFSR